MSKLRVLELFAGVGGFSCGLDKTGGFETVAVCEINSYCRAVLKKHWPEAYQYDDVRELTADRLRADGITVDIITGGFPCQDLSTSGTGLGLAGARSGLWYEYARLISEIQPRFVIVENSPELLDRWLGDVLGTLAKIGYNAEWHCIPLGATGAPHRRDRIWIIAYPSGERQPKSGRYIHAIRPAPEAYREADRLVHFVQGSAVPFVCGGHDGLSGSVDELTALGNAVGPEIPYQIGNAILESLAAERIAA